MSFQYEYALQPICNIFLFIMNDINMRSHGVNMSLGRPSVGLGLETARVNCIVISQVHEGLVLKLCAAICEC
jgi:hypothetical protein